MRLLDYYHSPEVMTTEVCRELDVPFCTMGITLVPLVLAGMSRYAPTTDAAIARPPVKCGVLRADACRRQSPAPTACRPCSGRGDATDEVGLVLGKPHVGVGTRRDAEGSTVPRRCRKFVMMPLGVMLATWLTASLVSVNQTLPSGPPVMSVAPLADVGMGNSVMCPRVVMRPILLPADSVNQRAPSGPDVMPMGALSLVGMSKSVKSPEVVTRPIPFVSVNQRAPSFRW